MTAARNGEVIVLSLPRSRTAWLCNWLSQDAAALHEPMVECAHLYDLDAKIRGACADRGAGLAVVADTAFPLMVDALLKHYPKARFLILERDPGEVHRSLLAAGLSGNDFPRLVAAYKAGVSKALRSDRPTLTANASDLDSASKAEIIHNWVFTGDTDNCAVPMDASRYATLRDFKVEAMLDRVVERIRANADRIERLASTHFSKV